MRTNALSNGPTPVPRYSSRCRGRDTGLAARLGLALAERVDPTNRIERFLQGAGVIAAVVDDRFAVAIWHAGPIRHLVGADHVAPSHLRGFHAKVRAIRSMVRSIAKAASGRPAPR
jgi:hypothetical protein